ncbi:ribonuclease P protein component [Methylobacterium persicinum]|uniref:Ribonuclease P protein component n=1 Tax=Methylobacterium persicinum TaxID=374426 RepID=A0ABU0HH38_9HYPH|nr:ribonuclease P protein component [Methylobacterium persicinum]MDQ0441636.1 ribonuclease P protein component [Methylobacterium persicinum]GJE39398.1 Ribonuclease P protein component [Methylobacterium persicinum]
MATIERLKKRPDFLAAAAGRRYHTERMTAQGILRSGEADGLRLGFTVTKRVGHATERNRIKRRLRAAVTHVAAALPPDLAGRAADIVLVARRPALYADFATLADDLRQAIPAVTRPGKAGAGDAGGRSKSSSPRSGKRPAAPPASPNKCVGVPDGQ